MIISRTPFRLSFFGGGTDYPSWYLKEGGAVISTTIDKYCYITARYLPPFFATKHRIVWSHIELTSSVKEILHPAVREGLPFMEFDDSLGIEIHHQGDLPARSGVGSSSSFAVGLIKVLSALKGEIIGKHELALKAIELEQQRLKDPVGCQDQVAAAYGGFNMIEFSQSGDIKVEPLTIPQGRLMALNNRLMLFFTGASRLGAQVAADVIAQMDKKTALLRRMREMVNESIKILNSDTNLDAFGELLHEGWTLKRDLSSMVSNNVVDSIYETARSHGAIGGKLMGAGGSGFMVFYVQPERREELRNAMQHFLEVPFRFETDGSTIIHYRPND